MAVLPQVEVLSDDVVRTRWATFHRMAAHVTEQDGTSYRQERDFLNRGNAVVVLPFCAAKRSVLLVRQFRLPVHVNDPADSMILEVCGGMLESNDSAEAVLAEVKEEIGVPVSGLRLAFSAYSSPGSLTEKIDYYLAEYGADEIIPESAGLHHEGEHITVVETTLDDAAEMVRSGVIRDLRTVAMLFFLLQELRPQDLHGAL